jgi:predicted RNA binding protein YcfA (HicA-like mRNA interferase family)
MSKLDKLIQKLKNNPRDVKIETVQKIADNYGLQYSWGKGDHMNIKHPELDYILTVPAHRPIKPIYIKKLLSMIEEI